MEIHIKILGGLFIILALIHVIFPGYFRWKTELLTLSPVNRQMMYVHTFFIALAVLLMGILCLTSADELTHTALGKNICLGLAIFWVVRLFFQFFIYSATLWKGKKFETAIHILFSFLWAYASIVFTLSYLHYL